MRVSEKWVNATEAAMKLEFPRAFKQRMMEQNGGEVQIGGEAWWLYPFRDETDRRSLRKTSDDMRHATQQLHADEIGFPEDGVAIAHNVAGDILFLRRVGSIVPSEVWLFRLHGGKITRLLDDVAELWSGLERHN